MLLIYIFLRKSGIAYRFLLKKNIYDEIGINVINCKVVNSYDSHGGMQYDGDLFVQVECKKIKEEALRKIKGWRALPLTNNLAFRIYGDIEQKNDLFQPTTEMYSIPIIENGYYLFIDRDGKSNKLEDIVNGKPYNYTLAIYDNSEKILYYFEHNV